jgi:hypothetical protein
VVGGLLVDRVGIRTMFWGGGRLLFLAGILRLALFQHPDFRAPDATAEDHADDAPNTQASS